MDESGEKVDPKMRREPGCVLHFFRKATCDACASQEHVLNDQGECSTCAASARSRYRYVVQHWECVDCGEVFSAPVQRADEWMVEHTKGCTAMTMRGRMTVAVGRRDRQVPTEFDSQGGSDAAS